MALWRSGVRLPYSPPSGTACPWRYTLSSAAFYLTGLNQWAASLGGGRWANGLPQTGAGQKIPICYLDHYNQAARRRSWDQRATSNRSPAMLANDLFPVLRQKSLRQIAAADSGSTTLVFWLDPSPIGLQPTRSRLTVFDILIKKHRGQRVNNQSCWLLTMRQFVQFTPYV